MSKGFGDSSLCTLNQTLFLTSQGVFSRRLLVGAPQAKLQGQVNVTGAVYQCDLSTTSPQCQPIEFDDEGLFVHFC